jgi:hypothetical protein
LFSGYGRIGTHPDHRRATRLGGFYCGDGIMDPGLIQILREKMREYFPGIE